MEGTQFWRNPHGYRLRCASRDAGLLREPSNALGDASAQNGRIRARRRVAVAVGVSLPRRVVLDDGTPRRSHLRWTTFLVLYGDLAKELRAFADVADAWLETLPNRPRRLQRDESGAEADEDLDDGEGAA